MQKPMTDDSPAPHPFLLALAAAPLETNEARIEREAATARLRVQAAQAALRHREHEARQAKEQLPPGATRDDLICNLIDSGRTQVEVAAQVGLSRARVQQILAKRDARRRKVWQDAQNATPGQQVDALIRNRSVLDVIAACDTSL